MLASGWCPGWQSLYITFRNVSKVIKHEGLCLSLLPSQLYFLKMMSQRTPNKPWYKFLPIVMYSPVLHCYASEQCFNYWDSLSISVKKGWNNEHIGCTREVNSSVLSFSLQSKLKCTNSWCTPAPDSGPTCLVSSAQETFTFLYMLTVTFQDFPRSIFLSQFWWYIWDTKAF